MRDAISGWRFAALTVLALGCFLSFAEAAPPRVVVTPTGDVQTVFDWSRDACETWDVPDAPARAFRDDAGIVHLMATDSTNRASVGPGLHSLRRDCTVVFQGRHQDSPERFDDRAWLAGFFTEDGKSVYALIHSEFQGNRRPEICPSKDYMRCWRNSITFALSRDGGRTFLQPDAHLVATPPYTYEADYGRHVGYFNPTNIIKKDGFYYAMFSTTEYRAQSWGACVMRTDRIGDPASWRAWDGHAFAASFVNPYAGPVSDPARHVCAPVGRGKLITPLGSIALHQPSNAYLIVMMGTRSALSGIYIAASWDLIEWSEPSLAWAVPRRSGGSECPGVVYDYPALMDAGSEDRNFSTVGASADLYLVAHKLDDCRSSPDRDLVRRAVRITVERGQP